MRKNINTNEKDYISSIFYKAIDILNQKGYKVIYAQESDIPDNIITDFIESKWFYDEANYPPGKGFRVFEEDNENVYVRKINDAKPYKIVFSSKVVLKQIPETFEAITDSLDQIILQKNIDTFILKNGVPVILGDKEIQEQLFKYNTILYEWANKL